MNITSIAITIPADDFFEGWEGEGTAGIDEGASVARYAELLEERVRRAFPDAEVEVETLSGVGGGNTAIDAGSWREEEDARNTVASIEYKLYEELGDSPDGAYVWIVPEE